MIRRNSFFPEDVVQNARMYDQYHREYHMEDGWEKGHKHANYWCMVKLSQMTETPISGSSCVDIGCGSGDFSLFLRKMGARRYLGIDIYKPSLDRARLKYPYEEFVQADILANPLSEKFDYAFSSGAFTVRLKMNNYEFLESMLTRMWKAVTVGMVFNVLTDSDPFSDPNLFYYSPTRVLGLCANIAKEGTIYAEETPYENQFHVYMYR